ncbi:MAG: hypothetical protein SGI94_00955, partial [Saprospiraceae bacterium]|nr:hypothetical protein [Saprospiraceae bacterium]
RREHSLSYATDDQRSLMEKATAQTGKLFTTRSLIDLLRRDHRGRKMATTHCQRIPLLEYPLGISPSGSLSHPLFAFFRSRSWAMFPQKAFDWVKNSSFFPPLTFFWHGSLNFLR